MSRRGLPESLELDLEQEERELPPRLFTADDAELLQSLLIFYEEFARHNHGDESVQWETAKAHHRIGDIRQHLGQLDLAIDAYDRAVAISSTRGAARRGKLRDAAGHRDRAEPARGDTYPRGRSA